jgi:hypothetical protein
VNYGPRSYFLYIAITCLLYSHTTIIFHSIRSYPLFQANGWDWQPHRKLGTKYLVVLCAGSTLPLAKQSLDEAPYKLSGAAAKLVGITFWSMSFFLLDWSPWFHNWGKTCCYIHQTFLGVSNWPVIYIINYTPAKHHKFSSTVTEDWRRRITNIKTVPSGYVVCQPP